MKIADKTDSYNKITTGPSSLPGSIDETLDTLVDNLLAETDWK